jgi:hypothetical protein
MRNKQSCQVLCGSGFLACDVLYKLGKLVYYH